MPGQNAQTWTWQTGGGKITLPVFVTVPDNYLPAHFSLDPLRISRTDLVCTQLSAPARPAGSWAPAL